MKNNLFLTSKTLILALLLLCLANPVSAATVKIQFNKALGASYTLLAIEEATGKTKTKSISSRSKSVSISISKPSRLYLRNSSGKIKKAIVVKKCTGKNFNSCGSTNVANLFKSGTIPVKVTSSPVLLAELKGKAYKNAISTSSFVRRAVLSASLNSSGQASMLGARSNSFPGVLATSSDSDADGLSNSVDSDDDGDGVLDNYDTTTQSGSSTTFNLFSNFKTEIDQTINLNAIGTLTRAQIDSAISSNQTLAIAVSGNSSSTVELDCGGLSYCSSGGTGRSNSQDFPGTAGGTFDPDSDGFGTITKGGTGDFQLQTEATSSQIGAGDTLIQKVTASGASTSSDLTGILNFIFLTNPAVSTIGTTVETLTVDYSASPRNGSRQRCLLAPSSGAVTVNITGWRPQRPGNTALGESEFMDIGRSLITIDIPNGACTSPNGSCAPQGPGNCVASSYSTSDTSLSVGTDGLVDGKDDQSASTSNTYSFAVNLQTCLDNASGGAVSWNSGETLFLDLQFRSQYGDNSAQKFCITRQ